MNDIKSAQRMLKFMEPRDFNNRPITSEEEREESNHKIIRYKEINELSIKMKDYTNIYNDLEKRIGVHIKNLYDNLPAIDATNPKRPPPLPRIPEPSSPKAAPTSPKTANVTATAGRAKVSESKPLPARPVSPSTTKPLPAKPISPSVAKPLPMPLTKPVSTRTAVTEKPPLPQIPSLQTPRKSTTTPVATPPTVESSENDLLAQIRKGRELKKANIEERSASPPPANDLNSLLKNKMATRFDVMAGKITPTLPSSPSASVVKRTLPRAARSVKLTQAASAPNTPKNANSPKPVVTKQSQSAPSTPRQDTPLYKKAISGETRVTPKQITPSIPTKTPITSATPEKPLAAAATFKTPTITSAASVAPTAPSAPTELPVSIFEGPALTKIASKRPSPVDTRATVDIGGLFAAIQKGKALKKVESPDVKKDDSTSASPKTPASLLNAFKQSKLAAELDKVAAAKETNTPKEISSDDDWEDKPSP